MLKERCLLRKENTSQPNEIHSICFSRTIKVLDLVYRLILAGRLPCMGLKSQHRAVPNGAWNQFRCSWFHQSKNPALFGRPAARFLIRKAKSLFIESDAEKDKEIQWTRLNTHSRKSAQADSNQITCSKWRQEDHNARPLRPKAQESQEPELRSIRWTISVPRKNIKSSPGIIRNQCRDTEGGDLCVSAVRLFCRRDVDRCGAISP